MSQENALGYMAENRSICCEGNVKKAVGSVRWRRLVSKRATAKGIENPLGL
jgi:hypothetical protein